MIGKYVPARGDVVTINFNPQAGKEQAGKRPAVVVSPKSYNEKTGLALCCPITSQIKGYPFEVSLPLGFKTKGVVLADHVKNLDWAARKVKFVEILSYSALGEVMDKLNLLLN